MARDRGASIIAAVAGDERQLVILERLYQHELPHCDGNQRRAAANVNRAIARQRGNESGVFSIPIELVSTLQDAGLSVLDVFGVIEESWAGLQAMKHRFASPIDAEGEVATHQLAISVLATTLQRDDCPNSLQHPRTLKAAIHAAWSRHHGGAEGFRDVLVHCGLLLDVGFDAGDVATVAAAYELSTLGDVIAGVRSGHVRTDEVLAIVRNAGAVVGITDSRRFFDAMSRFRHRVHLAAFLRTTRSIGLESAIAFHEHTKSSSVAVRAEEIRKQHVLNIGGYLLTYGALKECHAIRFEDYVELTAIWPPDVVSRVYVAYPSVDLLRNAAAQGLGSVVVQAMDAAVPWAALERFGVPLLRYLKGREDGALVAAADAFTRCDGDAAAADTLQALPLVLRDHPAVHRVIQEAGPATLSDRQLLELVVAVADAGHAVDIELLREFRRVGMWPNTKSMRLVYGLAQRFRAIGVPAADALRRAAEAHDRLSPRKCARAIRDGGYFRYAVLGEQPRAAAAIAVGADAPTTVERTWDADDDYWRPRHGEAAAPPGPEADGPERGVTLDLRTIHERLELRDLVPDRVDAETAAALILYGLCELGQGAPFAGGHGIPERHVFANVRRRFHPDDDLLHGAWGWLRSIGIVRMKSRSKFMLDLSGNHSSDVANETARRTSALLRWFNEQTRLR